MNLGFCTITSKSRLCQALAMYYSLKRNMQRFTLFILCTDKDTLNVLNGLSLEKVRVFSLYDVETNELLAIKAARTENEYCWTLKPVFLSFVLKNFPEIDIVTHADADLYFFSDPLPIFSEAASHSVLLTKHLHLVNDDVNSGFVIFKRSREGILCLDWWKEQCIGWCFFRKEDDKFGDQSYLDKMLEKFNGVHVVDTHGVNIAPWNSFRFTFERRGLKTYANDDVLIFYHFCGFRLLNAKEYGQIYSPESIPVVYGPYIEELKIVINQIESISPGFCSDIAYDITYSKLVVRGVL